MDQQEINKAVEKIVKIIVDRKEFLPEIKAFVIDLKNGFCFYKESTRELYIGTRVKFPHKGLSNETYVIVQPTFYIIGANIKQMEVGDKVGTKIDYLLHSDRSIEDLNNLYNEIITKY